MLMIALTRNIASFYSFLTLSYLLKQRELLATHDVTVELVSPFDLRDL